MSSTIDVKSPPASPAVRFRNVNNSHTPLKLDSLNLSSNQSPLSRVVSPSNNYNHSGYQNPFERRNSGIPMTPSTESYMPFPRAQSPSPSPQLFSPSFSNAMVSSPLSLNQTLSPPSTPSIAKRQLANSSPRSSLASITSPTHRQSMSLAVSLSLAGSVASSRCSSISGQSRLSSNSRCSSNKFNSTWSETDDGVCDIFHLGDIFGEGILIDGQPVRSVELGFSSNERLRYEDRPKKMEVIKKLGTGSYAAVYAVKEVLDNDSDDEDTAFELSGVPSKTCRREPRMFALKALSKKDLDDSQLEIQMYEAKIHQSLPVHPNIVTLYHTLETQGWLFLLMEFCPGQDLYYWLQGRLDESSLDAEESSDDENDHDENQLSNEMTPSASTLAATPLAKPNSSFMDKYLGSKTPSTPSLLANVETKNTMEGRARLRLISRMFESMCEAVAICHEHGISHRDIKPENFIVADAVDFVETGVGKTRKERKVVCKLTDFGLSTTENLSSDFDCGSKSYMAFECRNNLNPCYNPKPADVWSLGIVLLNMLFKRNPWGEPTTDVDESFNYYCQDPVGFLTGAFALTKSAAGFLASKVLCEESNEHHRISAREFGKWAKDLHKHVELPNNGPQQISSKSMNNSSFTPIEIPTRPQSPPKLSRSQVLNDQLSDIAKERENEDLYNASLDPAFDDTLPSPLPLPERQLFNEDYDNDYNNNGNTSLTNNLDKIDEITQQPQRQPIQSAMLAFEDVDESKPNKSILSINGAANNNNHNNNVNNRRQTKVQKGTFENTTPTPMATAWNSYGQRRDRIEKRQQAAHQANNNNNNNNNNNSLIYIKQSLTSLLCSVQIQMFVHLSRNS